MRNIKSWKFGDSKREADYTLSLVISGKKTATSSLYDSYQRNNIPLPRKGDKNIIEDSKGVKRCLIITKKVEVKSFNKITKSFAYKEGEGDRTLEYWKEIHKKFFEKRLKRRNIKFSNDILVVCEEFKLLKLIDK